MARNSSNGKAIGWLIFLAVAFLALMPKAVWIGVGMMGGLGLLLYVIKKNGSDPEEEVEDQIQRRPAARPPRQNYSGTRVSMSSMQNEPVRVTTETESGPTPSAFRIPSPPISRGGAVWYPRGREVDIAGRRIPGSLIYVGKSLPTRTGSDDPCLIDPLAPVSAKGDFTLRQTSYWASYLTSTPAARAAYLDWLADGRRNPKADIGYVFLFFYGLERRVIMDAAKEEAAQADLPAIEEELAALLEVYGPLSGSFRQYGSALQDWIRVRKLTGKLYLSPLPEIPKGNEIPLVIRIALGQAAADGVPIPGHLALAWARHAPEIYFRTPATRCPEEFAQLFLHTYEKRFGVGMKITPNRTKIKCEYRPASAGLQNYHELRLTLPDLPDISILSNPLKMLGTVVWEANELLDPFSRYLGRNPDSKGSLEASLLLPISLWPNNLQNVLRGLKERVQAGIQVLPLQDVQSILGAKSAFTKDTFLGLAAALDSEGIGLEPDPLHGAKLPKPEEAVALFSVQPGERATKPTPAYQSALLAVQLASALASADGDFDDGEAAHLNKQIESWTHLSVYHRIRLFAHVQLLRKAPMSLTALKKKLEPLEAPAKLAIAEFMTTLAQVDGEVAPAEVKLLEKIYKALGLEPDKVFSDLHAVAAGAAPVSKAKAETQGFKLDPARIAALQKDTEQVSALLSKIFTEEEAAAPVVPESGEPQDEPEPQESLLGLDESHASLARLLLSRDEWTRIELEDAAADLELMLDGALEQINDASFDQYDAAFTEGEDPVTVNREIREKIAA